MRIKVNFKANNVKVPNNLKLLNSFIHKCLGKNEYHDNFSNYNISQLLNTKVVDGGKNLLCNNPYILVSSTNLNFMNDLVSAINGENFNDEIIFNNIEFVKSDLYGGYNFFKTVGPGILLKSKGKLINANDSNFSSKLKENILNRYKLNTGIDYKKDFNLSISKSLVRDVLIKNNKQTVSDIVFILESDKDLAEFIYNNGIGKSTGSGFGTLVRN